MHLSHALPRYFPAGRMLVVLLLVAHAPAASAPAAGARSERLAPAIRSRVAAEGSAVVMVRLRRLEGAVRGGKPWRELSADLEGRIRRMGGATVRRRFRWSPSMIVELRERTACDFLEAQEGIEKVELDVRGKGALVQSIPYIRADEVHNLGYHGEGTTVAVLDSGVDTDHPAIANAIIHEYHFLAQGADVGPGAEDDHGHGTNVAGIIASNGLEAPEGVAPGVKIVAVKVLDDENRGWLSDWAAGVDHVISLMEGSDGIRVDVINMSLVSNSTFEDVCDGEVSAFSQACRSAWDHGIAVFAASGNDSLNGFLTIPACYSSVISVGSVRDTLPDVVSLFTNRGPLLDLLAPGEAIYGPTKGGGAAFYSGTSQATPHAAGTACLLRQIDPEISPEMVKRVLTGTGRTVHDSRSGLDFPILDARAAVDAVLQAKFIRSDCNADGELDLSDAVHLLVYLFQGGLSLPCADACDANDDESLDLSDSVYVLNFQFLGGPAPPPPFEECGADPTGVGLGCAAFACP